MGLFFFNHSASLCLLVGASNLFTFKVIIDMYAPIGVSLIAQLLKNLPAMQETLIQLLGWEDLLEKE